MFDYKKKYFKIGVVLLIIFLVYNYRYDLIFTINNNIYFDYYPYNNYKNKNYKDFLESYNFELEIINYDYDCSKLNDNGMLEVYGLLFEVKYKKEHYILIEFEEIVVLKEIEGTYGQIEVRKKNELSQSIKNYNIKEITLVKDYQYIYPK